MNPPTPLQLYKHEQAKRDLLNIYAFLSSRSELAADRFLEESRKAFDRILQMPGIGRRWEPAISSLPELRVTSVSRRFRKYLIFYRLVGDRVHIVSILQGARDLQRLLESLRWTMIYTVQDDGVITQRESIPPRK